MAVAHICVAEVMCVWAGRFPLGLLPGFWQHSVMDSVCTSPETDLRPHPYEGDGGLGMGKQLSIPVNRNFSVLKVLRYFVILWGWRILCKFNYYCDTAESLHSTKYCLGNTGLKHEKILSGARLWIFLWMRLFFKCSQQAGKIKFSLVRFTVQRKRENS